MPPTSTRSGSENAWTDLEVTCFHQEVNNESLGESLCRFAACFAAPLLKVSALPGNEAANPSSSRLCSEMPIASELVLHVRERSRVQYVFVGEFR